MKSLLQPKFRLSIRTRFFILLFLLTTLPFIAYRFAIDLHRLLLQNQATIQQQTVENLALILENRTDLWALQIEKGVPNHLPHLNLDNSALWIINEYGQTTYVVGNLPMKQQVKVYKDPFAFIGEKLIEGFSYILPFSFPYPYPQSETPQHTLVENALKGKTYQQYRLDHRGKPVSLMSATPLSVNGHIIGVIVLEQNLDTLFGDTLRHFYHLIGLSSLIFLFVILGMILYTLSLSNRIIRLDLDVNRTFDQGLRLSKSFPDTQRGENYDEIAQLRHHIYQLLSELEGYERYLKQLPKMLRHELHNPLNRLTMALSLLEKEHDPQQVQYANRAIEQLKKIINALSEASSIEESLERQEPESYPLDEMLNAYFENLNETPLKAHLKTDCRLPSPTCILGDGFMMEQLLDKLISNAKDFKIDGSLIDIRCYEIADKNCVRIEVRNKGPFIPDNSEQRIFDGMTSIRPVNSGEETHLGLGLYIAKLIAEYHGGKIWATNDFEHKEVVFNLEVPVQDPSLCSL